jgi:hypothetical protein
VKDLAKCSAMLGISWDFLCPAWWNGLAERSAARRGKSFRIDLTKPLNGTSDSASWLILGIFGGTEVARLVKGLALDFAGLKIADGPPGWFVDRPWRNPQRKLEICTRHGSIYWVSHHSRAFWSAEH